MEPYLGKKYRLKTSGPNFEEYLKYIGVGFLSRKTALAVSPVSTLVKNDDGSYTLEMSTSFRTVTTTFRLGEEFIEERADGVKVKSVMTIEGNKLIQNQTDDDGKKSKHVREFLPDQMIVTTTAEGWDQTCVRTYELIQ